MARLRWRAPCASASCSWRSPRHRAPSPNSSTSISNYHDSPSPSSRARWPSWPASPARCCCSKCVLRLLPVLGGTYAADPRRSWPVHTMIPNSRLHVFHRLEPAEHPSRAHQQLRLRGAVRLRDQRTPAAATSPCSATATSKRMMNDYGDTLQGALNDYLKTPRDGAELRHGGRRDAGLSRHRRRWCAGVLAAMGGVRDHGRRLHARLLRRPGFFKWQRGSVAAREAWFPRSTARASSKWLRTVALIRYLRGNLLAAARRAHPVAARRWITPRARRPAATRFCQKRMKRCSQAFARELPAALALPPGARHPGLRFGPQGDLCRENPGRKRANASPGRARPTTASRSSRRRPACT